MCSLHPSPLDFPEQIDVKLKDLRATLSNIPDTRPFEGLTVRIFQPTARQLPSWSVPETRKLPRLGDWMGLRTTHDLLYAQVEEAGSVKHTHASSRRSST
jgi:hypothetical protein